MNNCEKCLSSYQSYKTDKEDIGTTWCQEPQGKRVGNEFVIDTPKGLCQFCNPKSKCYLKK